LNGRRLIGVDFDNTIVGYGRVFHAVGVKNGWIPNDLPPSKDAVRQHIRAAHGEEAWTRMQGDVYGAHMSEAELMDGVREFFHAAREDRVELHIISHKTRTPPLGPPHDLHQAALDWLDQKRFFTADGLGFPRERVHFLPTRDGKIRRIQELRCTHFVDDLPEVFKEAEFPTECECLLLDPGDECPDSPRYRRVRSWAELRRALLP